MVNVGFLNLKKVYDKVNREPPFQEMGMCYVGGKLLDGIKSICMLKV